MTECIELIKHFESLELETYLCPASKLTIGYGCTREEHAYKGNKITQLVAEGLLTEDILEARSKVLKRLARSARSPELYALTSQAFNLTTKSTSKLVSYFNQDKELYKNKSLLYNKDLKLKKTMNGLLIRRICERFYLRVKSGNTLPQNYSIVID